jgi:uncharacterized protein YndB with AHSA1/START domain
MAAMPTARVSRTIAAPREQLWQILSDPYHLPRWWPRVTRVEDVADGAFTEVMKTRAGKTVRADFDVVGSDERSGTVVWEQRLDGTPFAGVLSSSETEVRVAAATGGSVGGLAAPTGCSSEVTIEMRQELSNRPIAALGRRRMPSMAGRMVRRAATRTIQEALDGLERISV